MSILDNFFKLGERVTHGDIVRKSQFDYYLYWIIFLAFISIAITYYYNFFFGNAAISTLFWGIIITIFCWFNYWALTAFRGVYENMKEASKILNKKSESPDEMLKEFEKNGK